MRKTANYGPTKSNDGSCAESKLVTLKLAPFLRCLQHSALTNWKGPLPGKSESYNWHLKKKSKKVDNDEDEFNPNANKKQKKLDKEEERPE